MHFPNNYPTILRTEDPPIDAVAVKDGALFVVLSTDAVTLWHAETLLQLHSIRRVTASLESTGFNRRLILREDDLMVIVQTTGNVLLLYDLCESSDPSERVYASANFPGAPKVWLKHKRNIRVEAGIQTLCATAERLTLVTKKPAMIQTVNWNNTEEEVHTRSFALSKIDFLKNEDQGDSPRVVDITHSATYEIFVFLMSNGNVFLAKLDGNRWIGRLLNRAKSSESKAILTTFNDYSGVLSIAFSDKKIVSYVMPEVLGQSIEVLASYDATVMQGSLRSLSWSSDGRSLLICAEHGWSLISLLGHLVAQYSMQIPSTPSTETPPEITYGDNYVLRLATWVRSCYAVLFLPISSERLLITEMMSDQHCSIRHPDRLDFRRESSAAAFLRQNDELGPWSHLPLPPEFRLSGPLIHSSISKCRKHFAISCKRGLAIYDASIDKWKTYRDAQESSSVTVILDPIWHQHLLVVAVEQIDQGQQLRLLSNDLELDDVLDRVLVQGSMVAMISKNEFIYVCFSDYHLEQYQIVRTKSNAVKLLLRSRHNIPSTRFRPGVPVRELSVIHESGSPPGVHLRILQGDLLWLCHLSLLPNEDPAMTLIAKGIEWHQGLDGIGPLKNAVFGFDGHQMKLWFNLLSYTSTDQELMRPSVTFDLEYYPLAISLDSGLIEGLTTTEVPATKLMPSSWSMDNTTTSFLPFVLVALLSKNLNGEAVIVASRYSHLSYFNHFLEILLNKALEDEQESRSGLLKNAWALIENYPQLLPKIVAGVARKSESAYWNSLFKVTGDPFSFYTVALDEGDLPTAGAFLIVLYTINPQLDHDQYTLSLFRRAIYEEDWDLAVELSSFYSGISEDKEKAMKQMQALLEAESPEKT